MLGTKPPRMESVWVAVWLGQADEQYQNKSLISGTIGAAHSRILGIVD